MSAPMTFPELRDLLQHIDKEHSPIRFHRTGKTVKYVDPNIDLRTGSVFSITFRGYGWEHNLHTMNEQRDLPESLFDRCMAFLDNPTTDQPTTQPPSISPSTGATAALAFQTVPVEPNKALLRPFYECPPDELEIAWHAMIVIARNLSAANDERRQQCALGGSND